MKKTEDMFEVLKRDVEIPDIVMKKAEGAFAKIQEEDKILEKTKITPLSQKKKRKKQSIYSGRACGRCRRVKNRKRYLDKFSGGTQRRKFT